MKLSNNQIAIATSAGVCSLVVSVLVASGNVSVRLLSLAGLLAVPPSAIAFITLDNRAQSKINAAQRKLSDAITEGNQIKSKLTVEENRSAKLQSELASLQSSFNRAKEVLKACEAERCQSALDINQLNQSVAKLESDLLMAQTRIEELEDDCDEWKREFHTRIDLEAEQRFQVAKKAEIRKIEGENDEITREAIEIARSFRQWAMQVDERLQDRGEYIKGVTNAYNTHLEGLKGTVSRQVDEYLKQIEILNNKVAMLQQKLAGDLIEPHYGQFGYAVEGKIANDLARRIWEDLQIPLAVKGYEIKRDGSVDVGFGYSCSIQVERLVSDLQRHSGDLAKWLGIHKITSVRKLEIAELLVLTFRREPAVKEDTVKLLAGSPQEFISYVTSHPIRYRLIADPGQGKTPVTAVMVSEILKVGGTRGNTGKGKKIPHTLVSVSCPDVESSQKDADYPLEIFLKYGNTTTAVKSLDDALEDWQYRKRDTHYAETFFQLWVWDELDNTLSSASDPKGTGEGFKKILKQCHHTGVGWIVSGQSVMTSQIPGFMDDDRELFTQIIVGVTKIRKYLEKYGKKILSAKVVNQLLSNLDHLEPYIEDKNSWVTDAARLLRLALVLDDKSPKLYFLPNLDRVNFDAETIEQTRKKAELVKRSFLAGTTDSRMATDSQNAFTVSTDLKMTVPSNSPIGGSSQSGQKPHCCHCGSSNLNLLNDGRYRCLECKKRFVSNKAVWK
jgi:hypothetical protein